MVENHQDEIWLWELMVGNDQDELGLMGVNGWQSQTNYVGLIGVMSGNHQNELMLLGANDWQSRGQTRVNGS